MPQLLAQAGDGVQATVDTSLQLVGELRNRFGPVAGEPVMFRITTAPPCPPADGACQAASLARDSVTTDADGRAATTLRVGTKVGTIEVAASTAGVEPVVFQVTGTADRATARLQTVSGNNQVGLPGQVLREPLVVRLEDQFANPLVGEAITAEIIEGFGGFVDAPQQGPQRRGRAGVPRQADGAPRRTEVTEAPRGETRFFLRVESVGGEVRVQAAAPALPEAGEEQVRSQWRASQWVIIPGRLQSGTSTGMAASIWRPPTHPPVMCRCCWGRGRAVCGRTALCGGRYPPGGHSRGLQRGWPPRSGDRQRGFRRCVSAAGTGGWDVCGRTALPGGRFPPGGYSRGLQRGWPPRSGDRQHGSSDDVSVLLGQGDGTFAAEQHFAAGDNPESVTVGDFNGDGRLDLATARAISSDVSVLAGTGGWDVCSRTELCGGC